MDLNPRSSTHALGTRHRARISFSKLLEQRPLFSASGDDTLRCDIHCSRVRPRLGVRGLRRRLDEGAVLFFIVLGLGAMSCAAFVALVHGQERDGLTPQLALARVCASEAGLSGAPAECAAIADVLRDRAERNGWTFVGAARRYSSGVFDRTRRDPRAWVAFLRPDGARPDVWPGAPHVAWNAALRDRWLALYAAAGAIVRGEIASECDGVVHHWGMRTGVDHRRAVSFGWEPVPCWVPCVPEGCGPSSGADAPPGRCPTRNAFWAVPSRRADRD